MADLRMDELRVSGGQARERKAESKRRRRMRTV